MKNKVMFLGFSIVLSYISIVSETRESQIIYRNSYIHYKEFIFFILFIIIFFSFYLLTEYLLKIYINNKDKEIKTIAYRLKKAFRDYDSHAVILSQYIDFRFSENLVDMPFDLRDREVMGQCLPIKDIITLTNKKEELITRRDIADAIMLYFENKYGFVFLD